MADTLLKKTANTGSSFFQADRGSKPGKPQGVLEYKQKVKRQLLVTIRNALIGSFCQMVPNTVLLKHSHELTELNGLT